MTDRDYTNRLLDNLPSFFNKSEISNNYKLLKSFGVVLDTTDTNVGNLKLDLQIDTMSGTALDDFAKLFSLNRNSEETDDAFRARIKAYWSGSTKGGTASAIISAITNATGLSDSDVTVNEDTLKITISIAITTSTDITTINNILNDLIPSIIAAGVYWKENSTEYTSSDNLFLVNFSSINGEDYML